MLRRNITRRLEFSARNALKKNLQKWCCFSTVHSIDKPSDQKLRTDIKHLGSILGSSIRVHDDGVFESVEELRLLGREVRYYCEYRQLNCCSKYGK
jgi:hypothetical protein